MRIRRFFEALLNLPQPVDLRLLYDAMDNAIRGRGRRVVMAELIRRASARQPLMLVVEDLHWADESTLQHLAELTVTVPECPAVLVMTSRLEGDPIDEAWRGAAHGSPLLTLDLGSLRRQETIALAGGTMRPCPGWPWPASRAQRVTRYFWSNFCALPRRRLRRPFPARFKASSWPGSINWIRLTNRHCRPPQSLANASPWTRSAAFCETQPTPAPS